MDTGLPPQITISPIPSSIDISDITIEQGKCFINAYKTASKYPKLEIAEGFILFIDINNGAKAMPHVWNKNDQLHFDVTDEVVWKGREELRETKDIKYFFVRSHLSKDFATGDTFEFCLDTKLNVDSINSLLLKTRKK